MMSAFDFPWEKGEEPFYTNEKGYNWYKDKNTQHYLDHYPSLKGITVVFIKKGNEITRGLIENGKLLYTNQSLETMGCFIDILAKDEEYDNRKL